MGKLEGRVAIITGGAGGQGEPTARLFVSEGARVVIADIMEEEGQKLAAEIGDAALFVRLDVTSEEGWAACVKAALDRWGRIDILVNNAGILHGATVLELELADFERVLKINVLGSWLGIKATAPTMVEAGRGAIVNIASIAGLVGLNGLTAYTSSKWALRGLTRTAAMELGQRGVRVNAICPGVINTRMSSAISNDSQEEQTRRWSKKQPIQRIGEPLDVARTTLFLVSDDASYICGIEVAVDGGMTAGIFSDGLPGAPQ